MAMQQALVLLHRRFFVRNVAAHNSCGLHKRFIARFAFALRSLYNLCSTSRRQRTIWGTFDCFRRRSNRDGSLISGGCADPAIVHTKCSCVLPGPLNLTI